MKRLLCGGMLMLIAFVSLPSTSNAFFRRSHSAEVTGSATQNGVVSSENGNTSPQAVPEPPVLFLMTIGVSGLALLSAVRRLRRHSRSGASHAVH
jgi:hypothetical protein